MRRLNYLAIFLQRNRAYRAGAGASAAFNAFGFVNFSFAFHFADGGYGASRFASTAIDANIRIHFISHDIFSYIPKMVLKLYINYTKKHSFCVFIVGKYLLIRREVLW